MRSLLSTLALLVFAAPLAAQKPQGRDDDPTHKVAGGTVPAGWTVRVDDKDAVRGMSSANLKFVGMGTGYHVTAGPAAILYNPNDVVTGNYTVHASFTQTKAPMHPEAYGLVIGGKNLPDSTQEYMYFIVRGDGKYMINHRGGSVVHKLVDWTPSDAVHKADESGKATNDLAVRVTSDSVAFIANGTPVQTFAKSELHGFNTDGQAGFRVNHNLDVHVANFGITK